MFEKYFNEDLEKYIKDSQKRICLNEFKRNYNKGEFTRVAEELCFEEKLENKILEDELMSKIDPKYKLSVTTMGDIIVYEHLEDGVNSDGTKWSSWKQSDFIKSGIDLPYAYVMGKKVGKTIARKILSQYGYTLD